ncbi:MAG TPA: hypothetical protein VFT42_10265 [Solirubrobacteraceae bacterium]|nr:hypothetical protein [Solirubrobacteraceae bacterium]
MRRALALAALLLVAALLGGGGASALDRPTGWDGSNPFNCELQWAGYGTQVPHPDADPYCVEFDKRRQNVTDLGIVDFLSKEPARVAAASPKCFYFQVDHWRGSIVQDDGSTKTYEWDGHYYFDKARGDGGAWVTNFDIGGHTGDPSEIPGIPPDIAKDMGEGTGGATSRDDIPADPRCAALAQKDPQAIYGPQAQSQVAGARAASCRAPSGPAGGRQLGPVTLGDSEERVRAQLGDPVAVSRGFLHFCLAGGGKYLVGERGDRSGTLGSGDEPAVMVLTTRAEYRLRGIGRGASLRALRRAFPRARHIRGTSAWAAAPRSPWLFGISARRVRYLAVYDRRAIRSHRGLALLLRRAG